MTLRTRGPDRLRLGRSIDLSSVAMALLLVAAAAFLFHETRATTFRVDEWTWILQRRGNHLATFLAPHNEHLSLVPIVIYRLLFASAGLTDYTPYRAVGIGLDLLCVALVYAYAHRRVGGFLAMLAATLLLFLGPGWEEVLWPFGMTYLLSLASGVGALLMLDRDDTVGDAAACLLLVVSLASSGIGVAVAIGVCVELVMQRSRRRRLWVIAAPLALYALWWLDYQSVIFVRHALVLAPSFTATAAASTLGALLGLAGTSQQPPAFDPTTLETWGTALLVAALVALVWRLKRIPVSSRAVCLLAILLAFWLLTAVSRAFISTPFTSRYLFVSALFVLLLASELARGVIVTAPARALLAVVAVGAVISNVGVFRDAARFLRDEGRTTRAVLGGLELARPLVSPGYVVSDLPGFPFATVHAEAYFKATKALGSPASKSAEIAREPEDARRAVDAALIRIHHPRPAPTPGASPREPAPAVVSVASGSLTRSGPCVAFTPEPATPAGATAQVAVNVPSSGLLVTASGGQAALGVRRFADEFEPFGQLAPGALAKLAIAGDGLRRPWQLSLQPAGAVTVCGA